MWSLVGVVGLLDAADKKLRRWRRHRVYTVAMSVRLADATGTVATIIAGVLLAALSLSAFGAATTLLVFFALSLVATATHRAISRHR
jgi:hypothetical protein